MNFKVLKSSYKLLITRIQTLIISRKLYITLLFPSWVRFSKVCHAESRSLVCSLNYRRTQSGTLMLFVMQPYVSEERSSERPFLLPLASIIISTTFEKMSLISDLSASFPNMKLFASTQEIDSPYFSETSWCEVIASFHFFCTFLFLVVDPKFELF